MEKRQPNWTHKSVEDVHPDEVQAFFESLRGTEPTFPFSLFAFFIFSLLISFNVVVCGCCWVLWLAEDELDIRSLDEERAEDSAIQQLIDKQRRFKKMMRRPWVQNEAK